MKILLILLISFFTITVYSQTDVDILKNELNRSRHEFYSVVNAKRKSDSIAKKETKRANSYEKKYIAAKRKLTEDSIRIKTYKELINIKDSLNDFFKIQLSIAQSQLENEKDENAKARALHNLTERQASQQKLRDSITIASLKDDLESIRKLNKNLELQVNTLYIEIDKEVLNVIGYQRDRIINSAYDNAGQVLDEKNTHEINTNLLKYINIETKKLFNIDNKSYKYELKYINESKVSTPIIKDGRIEGTGALQIPLPLNNFEKYKKGYFILSVYFEKNEKRIVFEKRFSFN